MNALSTPDAVVFGLVLAARLLVPLLIPRFPLPTVLAAMVIDGVDGGIFSSFTSIDMGFYQSYDKALDVYYLAIAYLAVRRNWPGRFPVALLAGLWYYRLVGVLAFELTGARWLLMVFPNTFEYAFIALEVARTRWSPVRLSRRALVLTVATIWIVVKLPQEWWIHVAQLDFTDEFTRVTSTWPWTWAVIAALVAALGVLARWGLPRLPRPDWSVTFDADVVAERTGWRPVREVGPRGSMWNLALVEKLVFAALLTAILAEVYPGVSAPVSRVVLVVGLVVLATAALDVTRRLVRASLPTWARALVAFALTAAALVVFADLVAGRRGALGWVDALVFAYVITLVASLYDVFELRRLRRAGSVEVRSDVPSGAARTPAGAPG
ncbi:hypothetical protein [Miniimonas sp. S16]|uniref:hypothetical protein n=1 Tax=Miniimonas sp. S16 TaxID=2171623 RepID=UPI000D5295E3|nr:hypothetical protein [Miniimonas sp. S16]